MANAKFATEVLVAHADRTANPLIADNGEEDFMGRWEALVSIVRSFNASEKPIFALISVAIFALAPPVAVLLAMKL